MSYEWFFFPLRNPKAHVNEKMRPRIVWMNSSGIKHGLLNPNNCILSIVKDQATKLCETFSTFWLVICISTCQVQGAKKLGCILHFRAPAEKLSKFSDNLLLREMFCPNFTNVRQIFIPLYFFQSQNQKSIKSTATFWLLNFLRIPMSLHRILPPTWFDTASWWIIASSMEQPLKHSSDVLYRTSLVAKLTRGWEKLI